MIEVQDTDLHGVKLIVPSAFEDHRGSYVEIFDTERWRSVCADLEFVQDDVSYSRRDVLRGIHGDEVTTKLVTALYGECFSILADNRPDSPTYRQWQAFTLTHENRHQLLIPAGVGNSALARSETLVYHYKQTTHFVPGRQFTIHWNDPAWSFEWPIDEPILSARDEAGCHVES